MKISENAKQQNIDIDMLYYTPDDIENLMNDKKVFYFDDKFNPCYDFNYWNESNDYLNRYKWYGKRKVLHIFTDDLSEIKIKLSDDGFYQAVAIDPDGKEYHIIINQF